MLSSEDTNYRDVEKCRNSVFCMQEKCMFFLYLLINVHSVCWDVPLRNSNCACCIVCLFVCRQFPLFVVCLIIRHLKCLPFTHSTQLPRLAFLLEALLKQLSHSCYV